MLPQVVDDLRQGEYLRTTLSVWWCEDDYCDCYQVQVVRVYRHKLSSHLGAVHNVTIWQGSFFSQPDDDDRRVMIAEFDEAKRLFAGEANLNAREPDGWRHTNT